MGNEGECAVSIDHWFCPEHRHTMLVFAPPLRQGAHDQTSLLICHRAYCPKCWRRQRAELLAMCTAAAKLNPRQVRRNRLKVAA
jgi:hypothetical protein